MRHVVTVGGKTAYKINDKGDVKETMTKKEMRKAAKGCGFGKLRKQALELARTFNAFRKGDNPTDPMRRVINMMTSVDNFKEDVRTSIDTFSANAGLVASDAIKVTIPKKSKK